jgi:hypothetical protein
MTQSAPELKKTIRDLIRACPLGSPVITCPFAMLGLLSYESRESLLRGLSDEEHVRLFDLATECQCPGDPRRAGPTRKPDQTSPQ